MDNHGFCLLINGNAGSGKTTISRELVDRLSELHVLSQHVIFDLERHRFAPTGSYDYTNDSVREQTYTRAAHHYRKAIKRSENLIIDTGARDDITREPLIEIVPNMHVVYLECPLPLMFYRETMRSIRGENPEFQRGKFLYARAFASLILPKSYRFPQPGVTIPFEPPSKPHLVIETDKKTLDEEVSIILEYMKEKGFLSQR